MKQKCIDCLNKYPDGVQPVAGCQQGRCVDIEDEFHVDVAYDIADICYDIGWDWEGIEKASACKLLMLGKNKIIECAAVLQR